MFDEYEGDEGLEAGMDDESSDGDDLMDGGNDKLRQTLENAGLGDDQVQDLMRRVVPKSEHVRSTQQLQHQIQQLQQHMAQVQQQGKGDSEKDELEEFLKNSGLDPEQDAKIVELLRGVGKASQKKLDEKLKQVERDQAVLRTERVLESDWLPKMREVYGAEIEKVWSKLKNATMQALQQGVQTNPNYILTQYYPQQADKMRQKQKQRKERQKKQQADRLSMEGFANQRRTKPMPDGAPVSERNSGGGVHQPKSINQLAEEAEVAMRRARRRD